MMFDPFKQVKLQNAYSNLKDLKTSGKDVSVDDLKKLAGITENTSMGQELSKQATNLGKIQKEKNIRPGTDEWFKLWFAKPKLTGERPIGD